MKNIILKWLNTKVNYVNFKDDRDNFFSFNKNLSDMLFSSRVHHNDLKSSTCYLIEKCENNVLYEQHVPKQGNYTYNRFNIKINEYIYDKVKMKDASKKFTPKDNVKNMAIVIDLLNQLKHNYASKNNFLDKFDKYQYKDIFFDTNENNFAEYIKDANASLAEKSFDYQDFKLAYIDKIKYESDTFQEVGVFYPFVFDHDIFDNNFYLFEINHLRFQKNNNDFFINVEKFYKEYEANSDKSKKLFILEQYFTQPGFYYSKQFAYMDPFKNYEKYKKEYKFLKDFIENKNLNFEIFGLELLNLLNKAQISIVKFQHENLIDALSTTRSNNRLYSIRELVDIQMNKLENDEFKIDQLSKQNYRAILHALKFQPSDFKFTKNTTIEDMECFTQFPFFKENARMVLADMQSAINKDDASSLKYIFTYHKTKLSNLAKEYKLSLKAKNLLFDMLLDLVIFYNDKDKEKLSKPYNSTIEKIYQKNQNKDIEKIIDFGFQTKFMQQHNEYFNMYRPCAIKTENGQTKYMMKF